MACTEDMGASARTYPSFAECAEEAGVGRKVLYRATEVASVLGIHANSVRAEIRAGRMRSMLPPGRIRGQLIRPEWVDEWIREGTNG